MKSKAIIFDEPLRASIGEIDLPDPVQGQLLTRTIVTGVSTGTELRVYSGKRRAAIFPLIPGYENVGEVIKLGAGVDSFSLGDRVFHSGSACTGPYFSSWGAHIEYALVNVSKAFKIPASISPLNAVYSKTAAIAYHGIQRARLKTGESIAIVGQGMIGHLAAQIAKDIGATVIAIDPLQERLEVALKAGVDHVINASHQDVVATVKELTNNQLDVAVDVTGIAQTLNTTLQLLPAKSWGVPYQPSGRLLILGSYTEPVCFDYQGGLFDIEPDILVSRDSVSQDLLEVLGLLSTARINPGFIPATHHHYSDAGKGYSSLMRRETMRVIYHWRQIDK